MSRLKSPLRSLINSECGNSIVAFLRSRGRHAHIVAPDWLRRLVLDDQPGQKSEHRASWSPVPVLDLAILADRSNIVAIAEDAALEQALLGSLRARNKKARFFGLFHDILPAQLCGIAGFPSGQPISTLTRYALLCVPRSGSRFLAAVLMNRGVGAPREHLRQPLADVIANGNLGFSSAMTALENLGPHNEIFATKLISTFLISASQRQISTLENNVAWLVDRGYQIIGLRRPLNEAVVSSYIAFLMHQWHFFGALDDRSRAKLDRLVFDTGAAIDEYVRFRAEKAVIDSLVRRHRFPTVTYSEIQENVESVVERTCGLIHVDLSRLKEGRARVPVATRWESPTYTRFAERLAELLDERGDELDARTVARICAITSLNRPMAEALAAEVPRKAG